MTHPPSNPASSTSGAGPSSAEAVARRLQGAIEAALISSDRPLSAAKLAQVIAQTANITEQPPTVQNIAQAVRQLNRFYEETGRSFRIEEVAGGYVIMTLPQYGPLLQQLHRAQSATRLSPAAMETLAIIAYKQPILRAQIEAIRGVSCGEVLRSLMEKKLIRIVGRAEELGRPMLYGTTRTFLEVFGLASLKDLPKAEELKQWA